jgi:hypothetical protein
MNVLIAETSRAESGLLEGAARAYQWVANRQMLACSVVFLLTIGIRVALLPWMHIPKPAVHDEFSYLLASDTYASGRLTNPPHPLWQHFETFHVIQQPTYASKYPPLPGLVLAFGQKLFGQPWVGVLISAALMCAAMGWMLQGWTSPNTALLGALLIMLRLGIFDYWANSYFGGAIPAIGGALVFGAIARIALRGQFNHGATLGAGLGILLMSRPYDFLVLGLISAAVLAWPIRRKSLRTALLTAAVLAVAGAAMAYNNYRVTGSALTLPYLLHEQQYTVTSIFLWSKTHVEPVYHHALMRKYWAEWFVNAVKAAQSDPVGSFFAKLSDLYNFFFGFWPLFIPLLIWPYKLKTTEERLTAILLGASLIALVAPLAGTMPHYVASIACLLYLRFLQTLTRLWAWKPAGQILVTAAVALFMIHFATQVLDLRTGELVPRLALARDAVIQTLQKEPGQKLVLVRYSPQHPIHEEWVTNLAGIDAQPIVWAREMGPAQDRPLLQYFQTRSVWLLEPDQSPPKLTPYQSGWSDGPTGQRPTPTSACCWYSSMLKLAGFTHQ